MKHHLLEIITIVKINTDDGKGERQNDVPQGHSFLKNTLEVVWLIYHMVV